MISRDALKSVDADTRLKSALGGKQPLAALLDVDDLDRTQVCAPSYPGC